MDDKLAFIAIIILGLVLIAIIAILLLRLPRKKVEGFYPYGGGMYGNRGGMYGGFGMGGGMYGGGGFEDPFFFWRPPPPPECFALKNVATLVFDMSDPSKQSEYTQYTQPPFLSQTFQANNGLVDAVDKVISMCTEFTGGQKTLHGPIYVSLSGDPSGSTIEGRIFYIAYNQNNQLHPTENEISIANRWMQNQIDLYGTSTEVDGQYNDQLCQKNVGCTNCKGQRQEDLFTLDMTFNKVVPIAADDVQSLDLSAIHDSGALYYMPDKPSQLVSRNGKWIMCVQSDGSLVIKYQGTVVSQLQNSAMRQDNIVMVDNNGVQFMPSLGNRGDNNSAYVTYPIPKTYNGPFCLKITDDGKLLLLDGQNQQIPWSQMDPAIRDFAEGINRNYLNTINGNQPSKPQWIEDRWVIQKRLEKAYNMQLTSLQETSSTSSTYQQAHDLANKYIDSLDIMRLANIPLYFLCPDVPRPVTNSNVSSPNVGGSNVVTGSNVIINNGGSNISSQNTNVTTTPGTLLKMIGL